MLLLFFIHTECRKHFLLQFALIDTDRSATDLVSVQHHVIGVRFDLRIRMIQIFGCIMDRRLIVDHGLDLGGFRCRERMMPGYPAVSFFIVFKQREIQYPQ